MSVEYTPGDVLTGSSKLRSGGAALGKDDYYLAHAGENRALAFHAARLGGDVEAAIADLRSRFRAYRQGWSELPRRALESPEGFRRFLDDPYPPQCIDLELAAFCDLACPFCYRQFEVTPDKIAGEAFALSIIEQAARMGVPSMKFNWRGEPLLHPRIDRFVAAAKDQGILETLINTNGTHLSAARGAALIEAGLDVLILSFDGGTKATYEAMRPSRFDDNHFETVIENLRAFHRTRQRLGSAFPFIRVQMILTEDTRGEIAEYHALFDGYADEVTVTQYTERGGSLEDLSAEQRAKLRAHLEANELPADTPFMVTADGAIHVSARRVACHQPFQRLMVSYDGRVGMCCFDWGAKHTVGFASSEAIDKGHADYERVKARIDQGRKEFAPMAGAEIKPFANQPEPEVQSLGEIWTGKHINHVRQRHSDGAVDDIAVCAGCTFKDTYDWQPI